MTYTPSIQTAPYSSPRLCGRTLYRQIILTVSGYYKWDAAADKMAKIVEVESRCQQLPGLQSADGTFTITQSNAQVR